MIYSVTKLHEILKKTERLTNEFDYIEAIQ